jgi:predicted protein tyrosine phosphatase
LWEAYPEMRVPPVLVLGIPDEYEFMDPELVAMLHQRTEEILEGFGV